MVGGVGGEGGVAHWVGGREGERVYVGVDGNWEDGNEGRGRTVESLGTAGLSVRVCVCARACVYTGYLHMSSAMS